MSIGAVLEQRPAATSVGELRLLPHHQLHQHYRNLLTLSPEDLAVFACEELAAEVRLPEEQRREAVYRRFCAWLDLEDEEARILARAFDRGAAGLSADLDNRRIEAERDAILNGFGFADFRRLAGLVPWLRAERGLALIAEAVGEGHVAG
jgi:hypothetical protein